MPELRDDEAALIRKELHGLREELARFNDHRFVRIHNAPIKLIGYQFLRGLALGLGTVVGASALVSAVVLLLSQIEFVPILGDLAGQVIEEIEAERTQ